jgi:hypothetical protein
MAFDKIFLLFLCIKNPISVLFSFFWGMIVFWVD